MSRLRRVLPTVLVAGALIASPWAMTAATASSDPAFYSWGYNSDGQLGLGNTTDASTPQAVQLPSGVMFESLTAGGGHACGLTSTGAAYCWGDNYFGQLGVGNTTDALTPQAVQQPPGVTFESLTAGGAHSCGLTSAGAAYCWGVNFNGQLGVGNTTDALTPLAVMMPSGVTFESLTAAGNATCGLRSSGAAYCWGDNVSGQLGVGNTTDALTPLAVMMPSGVTFAAVTMGQYHTCGLTPAGAAYCWGYNASGQLGVGNTTDALTPLAVSMPPGVTFESLAAGAYHSCGLTSAGAAYCWGLNFFGQLGLNTTTDALTPLAVSMPAGVTFASLTAGAQHSCGLTSGGAAYCWGYNGSGQLGIGSTTDALAPQPVVGGVTLSALVAGSTSSSTYGLPLRAASGSEVPRAALQQFGRAESDVCDRQPDDLVDFPGLVNLKHQRWGASWAQWPNGGTGGFVCSRQPYYTSIDTWAVQ